jgi:cytochrome b561
MPLLGWGMLSAALMHGLIRRDGVLESMASWRPDSKD